MRILIVEDSKERQKQFEANLYTHDITIVETVEDAIKKLSNVIRWDVLFLDHDLGGQVYVPSDNKDTGYQVAKFLSDNKQYLPYNIIVHSLNYEGAKNILSLLKEQAMHIPFAWTKENLKRIGLVI